ncbi:MAG: hypothetical protein Q4A97_05860 [Comamonadaceae bacterium]|nr:hypothetical protein [Comamonadaceae bacterium]
MQATQKTIAGLALTAVAALLAGNASAQYGYHYDDGDRYRQHYDARFERGHSHYYPPYRPQPQVRHDDGRRERRRRNTELAVGALVAGGLLGYALSNATTASQPPVAPGQGGATPGYVMPPVQANPVYPAPVYQAPQYHQPYAPQPYYRAAPVDAPPVQHQYQTINGRTYYRPAQ